MTTGTSYHWKTQTQLKVAIMERLRDFVTNGMMIVRSFATLEEMRRISREGDSIAAQGACKDDRVLALAMGVRCWDERVRKRLISERRTRAAEEAKKRMSIRDQATMYSNSMLERFFAGKAGARRREAISAKKAEWRRR
jgi:hypothetical protein